MENISSIPERMREIELFGVPALFSKNQIPLDGVYPGMSLYELQGEDGRFIGSVLTPVSIPVLENGPRELEPDDLVMDTGAGYYTPSEFEEKYLRPEFDGMDRYGKED